MACSSYHCWSSLVLIALVGSVLAAHENPVPNPAAVVQCGHARFTVLSAKLIRMEYSYFGDAGDDRATVAVINRYFPTVDNFTVTRPNATSVEIETEDILLHYNDVPNVSFAQVNTAIIIKRSGFEWRPGTAEHQNLNGTYQSLDAYSDPMTANAGYWSNGSTSWNFGMMPGLVSRGGWHVMDDTLTMRLVPTTGPPASDVLPFWFQPPLTIDDVDWYFHAHGNQTSSSSDESTPAVSDYEAAIRFWAKLAGTPARMDRAALGIWTSRYYPYSATTIVDEVIAGFAEYDLPLHVIVLDMDWHIEPKEWNCFSWGAWDFNHTLFPHPQQFITALHEGIPLPTNGNNSFSPLRLSLNMHPQSGVDPCASRYPAFCKRMDAIECLFNLTVLSDMSNSSFTSAMYDIYLDAEPLVGVDYWWTDYGGTLLPPYSPSSPQLWSNMLWGGHNSMKSLGNRSFVLSRYGSDPYVTGLGNHRVPSLFTGDTFEHESALAYEVTTAASASNVLLSYVSHDIGGNHLGQGCEVGTGDPSNFTSSELLLRWVQFGALSSMFRTHCDHCERRPWMFPFHRDALFDAYRLRTALLPAIYTASIRATATGVALITPMYWEAPEESDAYAVPNYQYIFLQHILVAPIVTFVGNASNPAAMVSRTVWIPPGYWSTWDASDVIRGPTKDTHLYNTSMMPLWVRAGTLLPMQKTDRMQSVASSPDLLWTLFPAPGGFHWTNDVLKAFSGSASAVEDADTLRYAPLDEQLTTTAAYEFSVDQQLRKSRIALSVTASNTTYPGMPPTRQQSFVIRGFPLEAATNVTVMVNGVVAPRRRGPSSDPQAAYARTAAAAADPSWWVVEGGNFSLVSPVGSVVIEAGAQSTCCAHLVFVMEATW